MQKICWFSLKIKNFQLSGNYIMILKKLFSFFFLKFFVFCGIWKRPKRFVTLWVVPSWKERYANCTRKKLLKVWTLKQLDLILCQAFNYFIASTSLNIRRFKPHFSLCLLSSSLSFPSGSSMTLWVFLEQKFCEWYSFTKRFSLV